MGIRITQPGQAKAAAKTGAIVGKGKRAEEDRARAEREQVRAQQMAAQQQARQAALEWEQQKMMLNSQQDFAHEMRMRQAGLEAEARAQEWQVEKMELASRMDFEQDEQERLRHKAEYVAGRDTLDKKKDEMPDGEYERASFELASIYAPKGVTEAVDKIGYKEEKQSPNIQRRKELEAVVGPEFGRAMSLQELEEEVGIDGLSTEELTELGLDPADFPDAGSETENLPPVPVGRVRVVSPDGQTGTLTEEELLLDEYKDFRRLDEAVEQGLTPSSKGFGTIYGIPTPAKILWDYTQLNRKIQMEKMRQAKGTGRMSYGGGRRLE